MTEPAGQPASPPAIALAGIVKRFPGVVANDGVELTVEAGTIHAIIGQNGSGKSTLMKTLYGAHRPDEGTIDVNGQRQDFNSPRDAIALGIGMVYQHFMLAENLTVWENVVLGQEPGTRFRLGIGAARKELAALSTRYGLDVDPDELVADLGVGERQRVEILKVLYRGARLIILDEPTAVLVPQEVDELFASLRELVATGSTVIFISHKLDEVLDVADAITVLRDGRTVAEIPDPSTVTARDLAELMVGAELPRPETRSDTVTDVVGLEISGLAVEQDGRPVLQDLTISVRRGEIVGIAGVEGNGQQELVEALIGIRPLTAGRIVLDGTDVTALSTRERPERGLGYVPEDRHRDGLILTGTLWENVMLGHQRSAPFARGPWVDRKGARARTDRVISDFGVKTPSNDVAAYALSGGNQQKLIIGREMTTEPRVLLASHPTRGIDVGAQAAVWDEIRHARAAGLATLLISADLDELIGLSDRLVVMYRGRIVAELDPATVTPVDLGSYMTGARSAETVT